jgi:hypothetical protein
MEGSERMIDEEELVVSIMYWKCLWKMILMC